MDIDEIFEEIEYQTSPEEIEEVVIIRKKDLFKAACKIVRDEVRNDKGLYDGFLASIISAINEINKNGIPTRETMSICILERLLGEDR